MLKSLLPNLAAILKALSYFWLPGYCFFKVMMEKVVLHQCMLMLPIRSGFIIKGEMTIGNYQLLSHCIPEICLK